MSLDFAILGLLAEHPRSGYDLKTRCFDGPVKPFWSADQAQIYRTLDRLTKSGFVKAHRKRQSGKPDRRIYEVTQSGYDALGGWVSSAAPLPTLRDPFFLQLYFGADASDDVILAALTQRRAQHQQRLDELRAQSDALASRRDVSNRLMTLRQTAFDGAVTQERASIDWLDDCIEAVKDGALPGGHEKGIGQRHLFGM